MTVTLVSVIVAVAIGGIETLGLVSNQFSFHGAFWNVIGALNDNWGALGYAIVVLFVVSWLVSLTIYRVMRYDQIEARPSS